MIRFFKNLFKAKDPGPAPEAPYKVESPVVDLADIAIAQKPQPTKCGCGRSQTGFCVGLHKLTAKEWSIHADNPNKAPVAPKAKKAATKKPAAMKAPAKPKTPRKSKASK